MGVWRKPAGPGSAQVFALEMNKQCQEPFEDLEQPETGTAVGVETVSRSS
jgi:hypothetical protein